MTNRTPKEKMKTKQEIQELIEVAHSFLCGVDTEDANRAWYNLTQDLITALQEYQDMLDRVEDDYELVGIIDKACDQYGCDMYGAAEAIQQYIRGKNETS